MAADGTAAYGPGGRGFYGAVTVSERGQISLPAQARRDLGITPGTKLLVLGDPEQGLALMTLDRLMANLQGSNALLSMVREHMAGDPDQGTGDEESGDGGSADGAAS
ncbi:AbrB/MazE/SpoVT family DNA-binding domain-containing protein [Nocardiopsis halophila]|uniref:AbrB/MazE/SpoVT family DNA-binding domain-containing protein n=1 Tax=Nocardiopsis halophila TaxID=141692 RepID=UPI00034D7993|nr:AbrB/MazE/SpoVT family DNA-binding domain-containing protein [Nocardiopsis halophila]